MSEPRRLLQDGGSDLELTLLRSARADAPSPASRQKALLALGLAGSVGAAVTTTTAASTATTAAAKTAGTLALFKWIGAGVVGGLLTLGAISVVSPVTMGNPQRVPQTPPVWSTTGVPRSPAVAPPSLLAPPAETTAPTPPPIAPVEEAPPPKPALTAAPALARPAPTSLTQEVAALDGAREALAAGDASRTLRALDEHDRRFPGGMLGPEATVLRIEALALRGDRAAAVRLGNAFLEAHPQSPHAARLRTLLGIATPAAPPP
jgi:hypothetical protein